MDTLDWLLESDPAIRWQVLRGLTDSSPSEVAAERARVAQVGLGAAILAAQQIDGAWRRDEEPVWLTTLFTLLLLRSTGVDPANPAVESAIALLEKSMRWNDYPGCWDLRPADFNEIAPDQPHACKPGGNPLFEGEEEPCINGGVLALGAYFGRPNETLARRLLSEQLSDGGWNCEAPQSTRSSYHTTICVLEGLLEYERALGNAPEVAAARSRGNEYLLERSLFRRRSTGEIASSEFLELAFPPRYHYDILRALDYFRAAGIAPDLRMNEAVQLLESRRSPDGRWLLDRSYDEALAVPVGEACGEPSRWNTLRALRILRWFDRAVDGPASQQM